MNEVDWVDRCAGRLREQWPHAPDDELQDAARELFRERRWAEMQPEVAAVVWLRLGVLAQ